MEEGTIVVEGGCTLHLCRFCGICVHAYTIDEHWYVDLHYC